MKTFAIIPVKRFENAKTRLSPLLSLQDRVWLSALMLEDTLAALEGAPVAEVVVVSSDVRAKEIAMQFAGRGGRREPAAKVTFISEEKDSGVNHAVSLADRYCAGMDGGAFATTTAVGVDATIVIPQDLPLLDAAEVARMCDVAEKEGEEGVERGRGEGKCMVICPSLRYDGTNVLLRKPPSAIKRTHYDNDSYRMHIKEAREAGIPVREFLSARLMQDIDTPEDVREVLGYGQKSGPAAGNSRAISFLRSRLAGAL